MQIRSLLKSVQHNAMAAQNANQVMKTSFRGFAGGGPKKPPMPNDNTDFDVIIAGKYSSY